MPLPTVNVKAVPQFWQLPLAMLLERLTSSPDGLSNAPAIINGPSYAGKAFFQDLRMALRDLSNS